MAELSGSGKRFAQFPSVVTEKRSKVMDEFEEAWAFSVRLEECFGHLTMESLTSNETWCRLLAPDMSGNLGEFDYMGRKVTKDLIDFVFLSDRDDRPRLRLPFAKPKYITGTPGFGKSVSICAGVGFLLVKSHLAIKAKQLKETQGLPQSEEIKPEVTVNVPSNLLDVRVIPLDMGAPGEQEIPPNITSKQPEITSKGEANQLAKRETKMPDLATCRFLLLAGNYFVKDPVRAVYRALVLAYIHEPAVHKRLIAANEDAQEMLDFLRTRGEKMFIFIDDGNAMDVSKDDSPSVSNRKMAARGFIDEIPLECTTVICASVRSSLRKEIFKTHEVEFRTCVGGFNFTDLRVYLKRHGMSFEELDYRLTGTVPRLVDYWIRLKKGRLSSKYLLGENVKGLEKSLLEVIWKPVNNSDGRRTRNELLKAIAGRRISVLSEAMDSRCYYRGADGKGHCLTQHLQTLAHVWLAQELRRKQDRDMEAEVRYFTQGISESRNMCTIGWNAEEATILALKLLNVDITGANVTLSHHLHVVPVDKMTRSMVSLKKVSRSPTLFVNQNYNHIGADVYYADQQVLIVFQISVAKDAVKLHRHTKEVAKKIFKGNSRRKVLVWVLSDLEESAYVPEDKEADYEEVFTLFGDLHYALSSIDERVKELRGKVDMFCRQCGKDKTPEEVLCSFCNSWYHVGCTSYRNEEVWICGDCKVGHGLEVEEDDEDDFDTQDEDTEMEDDA
ncbi:hypothetical protein SELMODRAFT_410202 [Selaginella moellendorffii]|uniref:Zinc finger PHD-type domain-containing protein n=2 Tax=Selaginella moellendorffii TaxID=88036 RepID=D8RDZ2_SELML|nr:hypothetical protein SELMODRAFT_410202 [Selaginella moellendorffii]